MTPHTLVHIRRINTALQGDHIRLDLSDDAYRALLAAVQVAFEDVDSIPAEYADGANALWHTLIADIHAPA